MRGRAVNGGLRGTQTHPGLVGAAVPWVGAAAWQREGANLPRSGSVLMIARDAGSGRVTIGADGLPRADYWPAPRDINSLLSVRSSAPPAHG